MKTTVWIAGFASLQLLLCGTEFAVSQVDNKLTPAPAREAISALNVFPPIVHLNGPLASAHVIVSGQFPDGRLVDLTREAEYRFTDTPLARVKAGGKLRIANDGLGQLIVTARGRSAIVSVETHGAQEESAVAFSRDIVPILTKAGCNQGACHGGHHGKGGLRLSLLGFDPVFDYVQIVQDSEGRRVVFDEPDKSLILRKPSLALAQGGGRRLPANSPGYALLKAWLDEFYYIHMIIVTNISYIIYAIARIIDVETETVTDTSTFTEEQIQKLVS